MVSVDRGRYGCVIDESDDDSDFGHRRLLTAMKARELGKGSVVVGDRVLLAGDTSGSAGSLARIVRVQERTSVLRRSPDDTDPLERVVVANADQMVIVSALADPDPKTRFIDRCLVAAYDAGLEPLLVLTKSDLAAPRKIRAFYRPLDIPMLTTRQPLAAQTLSRLHKALDGRISVLIGQSGVGKSSLVNALVPDAGRAVGRRQRGDREGAAHLVVRDRAPAAGRQRLADRHPGRPRLRPRPRHPGPGDRGLRRPDRGNGRLPARLRPPVAGLRPGRVGGRARRQGPPGLAAPPAPLARIGRLGFPAPGPSRPPGLSSPPGAASPGAAWPMGTVPPDRQ